MKTYDLSLLWGVYQMESAFPRDARSAAHASRQVLTLRPNICSLFALTSAHSWPYLPPARSGTDQRGIARSHNLPDSLGATPTPINAAICCAGWGIQHPPRGGPPT